MPAPLHLLMSTPKPSAVSPAAPSRAIIASQVAALGRERPRRSRRAPACIRSPTRWRRTTSTSRGGHGDQRQNARRADSIFGGAQDRSSTSRGRTSLRARSRHVARASPCGRLHAEGGGIVFLERRVERAAVQRDRGVAMAPRRYDGTITSDGTNLPRGATASSSAGRAPCLVVASLRGELHRGRWDRGHGQRLDGATTQLTDLYVGLYEHRWSISSVAFRRDLQRHARGCFRARARSERGVDARDPAALGPVAGGVPTSDMRSRTPIRSPRPTRWYADGDLAGHERQTTTLRREPRVVQRPGGGGL